MLEGRDKGRVARLLRRNEVRSKSDSSKQQDATCEGPR